MSAPSEKATDFNNNGEVVRPGISSAFLKAQDIRHVDAVEAESLLGFRPRNNGSGIWIPYHDSFKPGPLIVNGRAFGRLRLDRPTPGAKYLSPREGGAQLYVPINAGPFGKQLVIVEGEFKSIALAQAGIRAVAIGGISSAMSQGKFIPALEKLLSKWPPETVYFLGDADTALIFAFSLEAVKLANTLPHGITLKLPRIPISSNNGIDDCRAALNSEFPAFWETITADAIFVSEKTDPSTLAVKLLIQQLAAIKTSPDWQGNHRHKIISLAAQLDPLPLDDLAKAVKTHLEISVSVFKQQVAKAASATQDSASADLRRKTKPTEPKLPEDYIILPSGTLGIYEAAKKTFELLAKAQNIFLRGDAVFHLASDPDEGGLLKLKSLSEQAFRSRIECHGKVMAWRAGPHSGYLLKADARCSFDNAAAMLASDAKNVLPSIAAVHCCPILVAAGNDITLLEKGYHPVLGGRLIVAGAKPHCMSIQQAVDLLLDALCEYDFVSPSDKSRALAAIIAPALKFGDLLKTHFPVFVLEADDSQAGKGLLLELIQTIFGEKPSLVSQRKGGVGGLDESLSQALINGRPFIQYDNIRGRIESQFFEMTMTCPYGATVPARVPHRGEVQIRPDRFVFQLSSNGFESTPDMANRSCLIRIKKRHDHAFRTFPEGDLLAHVAASQPEYLGAVYCVVTQWLLHGKHASTDLRGEGRFRHFTQVLDWIVQNIFAQAPLLDGHKEAQQRVATPSLNWLRQLAIALDSDARLEEPLSASELFETCQNHNVPIPGLADDAIESKAILRIGCLMAKVFGDRDTIDSEGFQIHRSETPFYSHECRKELKLKKYAFRHLATNN